MKRIIIYIIVLVLSLVIPEYGTDVGKLIPVEVVFLYIDEGSVVVETDAGLRGIGNTVNEAVQDLHEGASGTMFLDTAEYLLIEENAANQVNEIAVFLKGNVKVCKAEKGTDLIRAAAYLDVHPPKLDLKVAETSEITEKLEQTEEKQKIC